MSEQPCSIFRAPVFPSLFHSVQCVALSGQTASGYGVAATEPADCAEDTVQRSKGEVLKALFSCLNWPKLHHIPIFFLNLLVAKRMDLSRLTNCDSLLRWQKAVCHPTWAGDWPEKGNRRLSPQGNWDYSPWSVVRWAGKEVGSISPLHCLWELEQGTSLL